MYISKKAWVANALKDMVINSRKWGADYMICMANDIAWGRQDIMKLMSHDKPIIGGSSFGNCDPFNCHVADSYVEEKKAFRIVTNPKERKGIQRVAAVSELIIFRMDVFDKIPFPWFYGPDMIAGERMMTEDYYFFLQCKKHNVDVWVDWDVKIKHATTGVCTLNGDLVT